MRPKSILLFIKPGCPWCREAMDWLDERGLRYEMINVLADAAAWAEMERLSGQTRAPVIDVDGRILADFGAQELAAWWVTCGFPTP
jgi:monothiol glutaredoxin